MQDDPQTAEQQRRRLNIPVAVDPRNLDPRKAIDPATMERLLHAQSTARAGAGRHYRCYLHHRQSDYLSIWVCRSPCLE